MADFNQAVKIVLSHEGGYVNRPNDRGGQTNFGITQKTYDAFLEKMGVECKSVEFLTEVGARDIYKHLYWDVMHLDQVNDQKLANVMLDLGVLQGPQTIVKTIQRLLLDLEEDDGIVGSRTLDAINTSTTFRGQKVDSLALWVLQDSTEDFFMLAIRNKSQVVFLPGWLNRINSLLKIVMA